MLRQIFISIDALKQSKEFIRRYRPWEGWQSIGWISNLYLILAMIIGLKFLQALTYSFSHLFSVAGSSGHVEAGFGNLFTILFTSSNNFYQYLILFFSMALIYHIGGRTMQIIYRIPYRPSFKEFIHSQVRGAIVVMICFFLTKICIGVGTSVLSMIGFGWIHWLLKMIVSSFFFGTALIDGLHEVRGIAIRQGILHSYHQYPGIAIIIGGIGLALSCIPILGVIGVGLLSVPILIAIHRFESVHRAY